MGSIYLLFSFASNHLHIYKVCFILSLHFQPTIYPTGSRHNLLKTSHLLIERLQPTFRLQSGP